MAYLRAEKDYPGLIQLLNYFVDDLGLEKQKVVNMINNSSFKGFISSQEYQEWEKK